MSRPAAIDAELPILLCPNCYAPMRASNLTSSASAPPAVTYVCPDAGDDPACGSHQFLVYVIA